MIVRTPAALLGAFAGAFGIGALVMYFFDPVSGNRRRGLLRDQLQHTRHEIGDYAEGTAKDLRNRAYGLVAEARGLVERRLGERRSSASVDIDLSQEH
jgi:gas vesicle protein